MEHVLKKKVTLSKLKWKFKNFVEHLKLQLALLEEFCSFLLFLSYSSINWNKNAKINLLPKLQHKWQAHSLDTKRQSIRCVHHKSKIQSRILMSNTCITLSVLTNVKAKACHYQTSTTFQIPVEVLRSPSKTRCYGKSWDCFTEMIWRNVWVRAVKVELLIIFKGSTRFTVNKTENQMRAAQ